MAKAKKSKLDQLLQLVRLTHQFRDVERIILKDGKNAWENDAEHSYQLAMLAWYIVEIDKLPLNASKVIQIALVHDLVEVYAGDTPIFGDEELLATKQAREMAAMLQLKKEFPLFQGMNNLIEEYESQTSLEARFIKALDKLEPVINIFLDQGRLWKVKGITLQRLLDAKDVIPQISSELAPYYKELRTMLNQNRQELFNTADRSQREIKPGLYQHYKGHHYRVIGTALHTETEEQMVVYTREGESELFTRPLTMFQETVEVDGKQVNRFTNIEENDEVQ